MNDSLAAATPRVVANKIESRVMERWHSQPSKSNDNARSESPFRTGMYRERVCEGQKMRALVVPLHNKRVLEKSSGRLRQIISNVPWFLSAPFLSGLVFSRDGTIS